MTLVGRDSEVARISAMIRAVRDRGAALVVHGDAGIGKSALLAQAADTARVAGLRVLTMAGTEAEAHLPFGGLHQMLYPVHGAFGLLPPGQRAALRAALGLSDETVPDAFLVGFAVLNLLAELADSAPTLIVAEDAHWLDAATAGVLTFLARRLESEPILLLAAVRTGAGVTRWTGSGLPELAVRPLPETAATALLGRSAVALTGPERQRLLAEAAGNPLALIELPDAVAATRGSSTLAAPWLPLTARLERAFVERATALPPDTIMALQVAALNDGGALAEIEDATAALTGRRIGAERLRPAVDARLVELGEDRLTFRHPLIRSAIHQNAGPDRRRDVHRALASVLAADPDRQTWHLASAADRPDETVAAALEAVAARAQRRGSAATVVAALDRAARLSPDPHRRADRLLRAADAGVDLGRTEVVERLLGAAGSLDLTAGQRARAAWIGAAFDDGMRDRDTDATTLAELAGETAAAGDLDLGVRILWSAALRCFWSEPGPDARRRIVAVAEGLPLDPHDARLLAVLAYAAPIDRGAVVIERSRQVLAQPVPDPRAVRLIGSAAVLVGSFDVAVAQSAASLTGLRAQGRLQLLARALAAQAWSAVHLVDLAVAIPAAQEASDLAEETGQPYLLGLIRASQAKLAALRGDFDGARRLATEAEQRGLPVGARPVLATAQHARALAALGAGDHAEALERLLRLHDPGDPSYQLALRCHTIGDLADAAAHAGRTEAIGAIIAEMEEAATRTLSPSLHDGLRLARALLADDEALFRDALAQDLSRRPFVRARTALAYGEWLRRRRRVAESRQPLRAARDAFDALGAVPWGDRARRELRAAGERSGQRAAAATDRLTAHEFQIAQLAAQGLTNRDIGKRLYISHRTVGAHLAKIFPKIGVTSRVQLRDALEG
ncbi:LuxR family transcriptional regulator [Paractinoplanes deccanensis]|uniref:LuxR family transcriptional regulator n=1 Tax=Paractinoplanes deccanensis TaxID=113561 RepID=A0ABQ3XY15_9ACTN|nr:LuxR family transcriptional regulator [Actinoplanes deccanensis]GID72633.1 LuxR family transcriptional regulator [Actinoplanes deccanensis]